MKSTKMLRSLSVMFLVLVATSQLFAQKEIFRINQNFNGVKMVDVQGGACNVLISGTDRTDVLVSGFINGPDSQKNLTKITAEMKGDALVISFIGDENFVGVKGEIRVLVPINCAVNVTTQRGNIDISDMKGIMFDVASESGNIFAKDLTGKCRLNSITGSVSATKISGNITASSMTSTVEASSIQGVVKLSSTSGAIVASNVAENVFIKAGAASSKIVGVKGNVEIRAASGFSDISDLTGNIDIITASGSVSIEKLIGYMRCETASGDIKATNVTLVKGADISTLSGRISIQVMNGNSDLSFDLSTVSGKVSAKGVTDERTITYGSGAILIKGSTISGNLIIE